MNKLLRKKAELLDFFKIGYNGRRDSSVIELYEKNGKVKLEINMDYGDYFGANYLYEGNFDKEYPDLESVPTEFNIEEILVHRDEYGNCWYQLEITEVEYGE